MLNPLTNSQGRFGPQKIYDAAQRILELYKTQSEHDTRDSAPVPVPSVCSRQPPIYTGSQAVPGSSKIPPEISTEVTSPLPQPDGLLAPPQKQKEIRVLVVDDNNINLKVSYSVA